MIDPQAVIISKEHCEQELELVKRISSTGKGVGAALASKVLRREDLLLARDVPSLAPYIGDVAGALHKAIDANARILIEGTQGTGLSLHHGAIPFVTGRDTTAGSLCGEVGIGPTMVDRVIIVLRTYPIRVAGTSGPLADELGWDEVTKRSGYHIPLMEFTTVTGNLRRVGAFDPYMALRAVRLNGATEIALTFSDYLDASVRGCRDGSQLPQSVLSFVSSIEDLAQVPVTMVSTGPDTNDIIVRSR